MIGKDVPLADSHRHHSHLLWLHPLPNGAGTARATGT